MTKVTSNLDSPTPCQKGGSDSSPPDSGSSEDESENEVMMKYMKEMEYEMNIRKNRGKNGTIMSIATGIIGIIVGMLITRFIFYGKWKPLNECTIKNPPNFCHNCYGPFSGKWLWCVDE